MRQVRVCHRWLFGRSKRSATASQPGSPASAGPPAGPIDPSEQRTGVNLAIIAETSTFGGAAPLPRRSLSGSATATAEVPEQAARALPGSEGSPQNRAPSEQEQFRRAVLVAVDNPTRASGHAVDHLSSSTHAASTALHDGVDGRASSADGAGYMPSRAGQRQAARPPAPLLRWAAVPPAQLATEAMDPRQAASAEAEPMAAAADASWAMAAPASMAVTRAAEDPMSPNGSAQLAATSSAGYGMLSVPAAMQSVNADTTSTDRGGVAGYASTDPEPAPEPPAPLPSGSPTTDRTWHRPEDLAKLQVPSAPGRQEHGHIQRPHSALSDAVTASQQPSQQPQAEPSHCSSATRSSALQRLKARASRRQAVALSSSVEFAQQGWALPLAHAGAEEQDGPAALVLAAVGTRLQAWLQVPSLDSRKHARSRAAECDATWDVLLARSLSKEPAAARLPATPSWCMHCSVGLQGNMCVPQLLSCLRCACGRARSSGDGCRAVRRGSCAPRSATRQRC